MSVSIVEFTPERLPAVQRFVERSLSRPQREEFHRWRYLDAAPFSVTYIGLKDDECIGHVTALRKTYLLDGEARPCLEVFDWHALPEYKGAGVGLRVMRAMMRRGEPVMAIGGTRDVLSALPAMGWRNIGAARLFELPATTFAAADGIARRVGAPVALVQWTVGPLVRAWYTPRRRAAPAKAAVRASGAVGDDILRLYDGDTGYALVQRPRPDLVRWFTSGFWGNGAFAVLRFSVAGELRGWAMTRVYLVEHEVRASILEIFAPRPDVELYTWMVSEAARTVMGWRPRKIAARASCPALQDALRRNRFREERRDIPVHLWAEGWPETVAPLHITLNHSDEPLRPYPGP